MSCIVNESVEIIEKYISALFLFALVIWKLYLIFKIKALNKPIKKEKTLWH